LCFGAFRLVVKLLEREEKGRGSLCGSCAQTAIAVFPLALRDVPKRYGEGGGERKKKKKATGTPLIIETAFSAPVCWSGERVLGGG